MKTNIAIIGLGNIGRRYLQAASRLAGLQSVICYDKKENYRNEVNDFCMENSVDMSRVAFASDFTGFLAFINKKTVVIISTTAKGRIGIIKKVIGKVPLAIISEKPLCQAPGEYEKMMALVKKTGVPVYLNFSRHFYPVYKRIYGLMRKAKNKTFSAFFHSGMVCGGIHVLELATWLLDAKSYKILYSRKGKLIKSRRPGFWDFSGEVVFSINEQSLCFLKAAHHGTISSFRISGENNEFSIFELVKKMIELDSRNGTALISDIEIPLLSQSIGGIIGAIYGGKKVELPNIFQSYLAHKMLFECIRINKLEKLNMT